MKATIIILSVIVLGLIVYLIWKNRTTSPKIILPATNVSSPAKVETGSIPRPIK